MPRSKVCILHVGGTIAMTQAAAGLEPRAGVLERYLQQMPQLQRPDVPLHHVELLEPLLDSADMRPRDWVRIAQAIVERDAEFDGFVVVHGTDTMVHTASALSFLLTGLRKPVILTGSQLSLEHVRSDGREHLITSLILAGTQPIPEVCIYFASRLLRGNRAQKVDNAGFVAFGSGNLPPLATVGIDIHAADGEAVLSVRNPGTAIPADQLGRIFERFHRVDPARSRDGGEGTGLGLAIARSIVVAHGGRIEVHSAAGETTFTLHLPAYATRSAAPPTPA